MSEKRKAILFACAIGIFAMTICPPWNAVITVTRQGTTIHSTQEVYYGYTLFGTLPPDEYSYADTESRIMLYRIDIDQLAVQIIVWMTVCGAAFLIVGLTAPASACAEATNRLRVSDADGPDPARQSPFHPKRSCQDLPDSPRYD